MALAGERPSIRMKRAVGVSSRPSDGKVGMILIHNGIVRAFSKDGSPVKGMRLAYDKGQLEAILKDFRDRDGI